MRRANGLGRVLLAVLLWVFVPSARGDEGSTNHFYFVQITDTHFGSLDHYTRTQRIVEMINALPFKIECVVHTGDFGADNLDKPEVVTKGLDILHRLNAPVYILPGNHDITPRKLTGTLGAFTNEIGAVSQQVEVKGVVFLLVYTEPLTEPVTVPGYEPLAWLKAALEHANGKPVIVFHHTPSVEDFYGNKLHQVWRTDLLQKWVALLNAHNVKAVIAGHFHRDEFHWLGNVPLYVSSAIAGYWGRQATYRIYEYWDGKVSYRTQYLE